MQHTLISSASADHRNHDGRGPRAETFDDEARRLWGLGSVHATLKQYDQALQALDRAIELDPERQDARLKLWRLDTKGKNLLVEGLRSISDYLETAGWVSQTRASSSFPFHHSSNNAGSSPKWIN